MKILLVEDDKQLNMALKISLEEEGYAVESCFDGIEGEKQALMNHADFDLLILDLILPGKSGGDICNGVRKAGIQTPILILTSVSNTDNKVVLLDSGADDYLSKPFEFPELLARIRALLRRPKEVLPQDFSIGPLVLTSVTQTAKWNEKEIPLTLKEFRVLEYFARHAGQIITRDQLMDNVWDFASSSLSNIIDVHVANVRRKLEAAGGKEAIKTVRGSGYKLSI